MGTPRETTLAWQLSDAPIAESTTPSHPLWSQLAAVRVNSVISKIYDAGIYDAAAVYLYHVSRQLHMTGFSTVIGVSGTYVNVQFSGGVCGRQRHTFVW